MTDVFFLQDGRTLPIGELSDVYYPADGDNAFTESMNPIIFANSPEATIEINVPRKQAERFLQEVFGITRMVLDTVRDNGGVRVVHLARHARKVRTRWKNLHRAFRMLEKEANKNA